LPTIFSHPAAALGLAPWFRRVPKSLVVVAAVCSALPDADVMSFGMGIPYGAPLGHRGFTHSLCFAALLAAIVAFCYRRLSHAEIPAVLAFSFLFLVIASHGLLDAMTDGGRGIGFFIPFNNHRYFLPFRPIRVSPIGVNFEGSAMAVLSSEARWVWAPALLIGFTGWLLVRRAASTPPRSTP
jgi:inner membrane protein